MGLTDTYTIPRIVIHPTNPDVVYVAASGHEWTNNAERGVYKTDRRRQDVGEGAVRRRQDRRHRSRDGPGRPEHAVRVHVAAHPAEVERPAQLPRLRGQRHPQVDRRRQDVGADQQGPARAEVPRAHRPRRLPVDAERGLRVRRQLRAVARTDRGGEGRSLRAALVRVHQGRDRLPVGRQGRDVDAGERPHARAEDVHGAPLEHLRLGVRPDPRGPERRRTRSTRWASA